MALIRLIFFGFIGLTIVYFLVSIYSRSVRREKLEKAWAEDHPMPGNMAEVLNNQQSRYLPAWLLSQ